MQKDCICSTDQINRNDKPDLSYSWFRLNVTSAESSECCREMEESLSLIWLQGACCHDNWSSVCAVVRVKAILT